ncbi:MAG TPA: ABC transporter family substrate-binding protein [Acidimicrobiales bacterium]|nr:ABC transporter family substrate-binding protein [Acidimicrobiales bacterium]
MQLKKLATIAASLACAGLIMAACSSSTNSASGSGSGATTSVKSGGSLTYALDENIPGWNINTSADNEYVLQEVMNLIWPQTFLINPQLQPYLNTDLVTSATQTKSNPQTIVYKINPAAKWSDGQPINAEDFFYNYAAQSGATKSDGKTPLYTDIDGTPFDDASNTGYSQVKSVTNSAPASGSCQSATITGIGSIPCANGDTVTVVFASPFADWRSLFGNLVPAHKAATVGWNKGFVDYKNVVSGSWYKISNYVENQYVVLKKNPSYWGTPGKLDTITFQIFNGDTQAVPAMQNGEVQVINPIETSLSIVQAADQLTGVTKSLIGGLEFQHIDFNESDPYLALKSVRQAIAYGTDRNQIVARTVGEFDPSLKPLENRMLVPSQAGYQDNGAAYATLDVAKAKSLLQSAGLTMSSDGYFQPATGPQKGQDLTFTIKSTSGNDLRASIEQLFQADMKNIGIKINIANETASTLFGTDLPQGQYQMTLFAWVATPFISGNLSIYCSYTNTSACGQNWTHYSNPQVDSLLTAGAAASSSTTEVSDFNKADQILWSDMDTLPLFQAPVFTVWSNKYGNIVPNPASVGITWNAQEWGVKAS